MRLVGGSRDGETWDPPDLRPVWRFARQLPLPRTPVYYGEPPLVSMSPNETYRLVAEESSGEMILKFVDER